LRFNLVATNGQMIATSQAYESKASTTKGIDSVKRSPPTAEIDDQRAEAITKRSSESQVAGPITS
jgi:uncharacterized protein YegP (UPF0339 family)